MATTERMGVDPLAVMDDRIQHAKEAWEAGRGPYREAIAELHGNLVEARAAVAELVKAGTNAEEILKPCGIRTDSRRRHLASLVGLPWDAMADAIRNTARLRLRAALAPFSEAQS